MVKATTKKNAKKPLSIIKKIMLAVAIFIVAFALAYPVYEQYLDRKDSEKFMSLKQDMQALQSEFNKIDPGWTYGEGCNGQGGVYSDNLASSCSLGLSNKAISRVSIEQTADLYILAMNNNTSFSKKEQNLFSHDNKDYVEIILNYGKIEDANCSLLVKEDNISSIRAASLGCSDKARNFYFQRSDR